MLPIERPLQEIPSHRMRNLILCESLAVDLDVYSAGRMFVIGLHVIDVEAEFLHTAKRFNAWGILANTAGDDSVVAHKGSDVGKVRRRPAQTRAFGKNVPENLAETNDFLFHRLYPAEFAP